MMGKFILGDCMDLEAGLPSYPDKFFDLAIVDPPYGISVNMNTGRRKEWTVAKHKNNKWDNSSPNGDYFKELFRVSKNQIIWGGNHFVLPISKGWVFWDKQMPDGLTFSDGELAWTSFNVSLKKAKYTYTNFKGGDRGGKIHPTQKPLLLYRWLLENYAKPGQLILDTHVGSASSLIACESMGFDYVGFEIDPDYYAAAKNRMSKGIQAVLV